MQAGGDIANNKGGNSLSITEKSSNAEKNKVTKALQQEVENNTGTVYQSGGSLSVQEAK